MWFLIWKIQPSHLFCLKISVIYKLTAMSHRQSCWLSSSKKKGTGVERHHFIEKMKFAKICTKNVLGHSQTENNFLEIMAKSLDIQKNVKEWIPCSCFHLGPENGGWGKDEDNEKYRKLVCGQSSLLHMADYVGVGRSWQWRSWGRLSKLLLSFSYVERRPFRLRHRLNWEGLGKRTPEAEAV